MWSISMLLPTILQTACRKTLNAIEPLFSGGSALIWKSCVPSLSILWSKESIETLMPSITRRYVQVLSSPSLTIMKHLRPRLISRPKWWECSRRSALISSAGLLQRGESDISKRNIKDKLWLNSWLSVTNVNLKLCLVTFQQFANNKSKSETWPWERRTISENVKISNWCTLCFMLCRITARDSKFKKPLITCLVSNQKNRSLTMSCRRWGSTCTPCNLVTWKPGGEKFNIIRREMFDPSSTRFFLPGSFT